MHLLTLYKFLTYRYRSLQELVTLVKTVQRQFWFLSKQNERIKQKVAIAASKAKVIVDQELHIVVITKENNKLFDDQPCGSFMQWPKFKSVSCWNNTTQPPLGHPLPSNFITFKLHHLQSPFPSNSVSKLCQQSSKLGISTHFYFRGVACLWNSLLIIDLVSSFSSIVSQLKRVFGLSSDLGLIR